MLPSFLTMAVLGAEAGNDVRAKKSISDCYDTHTFGWMNWLIILTLTAIVALCLRHLRAARRRRIERQVLVEKR